MSKMGSPLPSQSVLTSYTVTTPIMYDTIISMEMCMFNPFMHNYKFCLPSTTSHSSSATSSPLVRMLNQLNSSRLIKPLPSKSHISNISDSASLRRVTIICFHRPLQHFEVEKTIFTAVSQNRFKQLRQFRRCPI